ncbi:glycosyltransferase family 4 protein [Cellulomonas sp. ATA003]|uniref:glycosyltransferase family 4 protein n=1 Tax=Cellulomonas sp. ATA003 TaxID=3073064 RepID=UPI002872B569|nr:glycosyltransferase family 4 protein [Cellulomonas sp. ATA003]WNB85208.1 glycosyltransferase family 4 protein [Cellulomonas sp. ATA003]
MRTGEGGPAGAYLIQHFEDWLADRAYVEETWRLPLRRLVVSGWLLRTAEQMGLTAEHVPNAIDAAEFPAGPPTDERPASVLALVSPHAWKRTDLVEGVYRQLGVSHPGVRLATFGVGPRPSGLPDSAVHHQNPSRAALRDLYRSSRVYLCASDSEGWGLPPAEAMSSGSAVVSTDLPSIREYADGVALFAPVGDGAELYRLVSELLDDGAECRRRGLAGVERMRAAGLDRSAAQLEGILSELAAHTGGIGQNRKEKWS